MVLVLNEEQRMVKETAEGFFAEHAPVGQLRKLRDSHDPDGFDRGLWAKMAEMGFAGVAIPEQYGGAGLGMVAAGLIQEAIGRNLSLSPFLSASVLAATAIAKAGSDEQKAALLPKIASAELIVALAADEKPRHQPHFVAARAESSGNGFRLTGAKPFVLDGHVADRLIVAARTSGEEGAPAGITLFLVDPKAAGVSVKRRAMVDSRNAAEIALEGVQVDGADVLGGIGEGFATLEAALDVGRACLAAEMLGVSGQSFDATVDYLKNREQFGVKIGSFQALQHRAAHLFCEMELARSATLKALTALDEGDARAPFFVALAKAKAGDVCRLATNEAVQMHGGIGMTDEFDIGFYMKRARAAQETFGDTAFQADRVARLLNY
ncbi:acyl-CoA/acyl-ACP dehydrogenase [Sandaracinobacter sp. RS1-74]|uniref:acyl-CoA dehydrogenase family protein n=1 Tax=Sandaracinobacteroides sayramensis TaxID=2913411 RepID=UPI001EDB67DE|nr:acyl-CoA dehydrogenase family protein [Sandaracinobacteroides sayramensis]MCG2839604.1 acyl-CoA/acyl-ACP dehydrogenase [Sandaracinobacteroides sayramensis]